MILQKYTAASNPMYCELCGSSSHNTNQCRTLYALANRLDQSAFWVNEGLGRGHRGRGGYRGGQTGRRGLVPCYNCDEHGHLA
jgi:hypothetical protein